MKMKIQYFNNNNNNECCIIIKEGVQIIIIPNRSPTSVTLSSSYNLSFQCSFVKYWTKNLKCTKSNVLYQKVNLLLYQWENEAFDGILESSGDGYINDMSIP